MKPRLSSGILLFRRRGRGLEVLLAHPGGPLFARRDLGAWTIPKGQPDGDPDLLKVAEREFEEETGHAIGAIAAPGSQPIPLGHVVQRGGKTVHCWAIEGDLDPRSASSNEFDIEWPPRSGRLIRAPEIDRVDWFEPARARDLANPAQAELIDRLEAALGGHARPEPAA